MYGGPLQMPLNQQSPQTLQLPLRSPSRPPQSTTHRRGHPAPDDNRPSASKYSFKDAELRAQSFALLHPWSNFVPRLLLDLTKRPDNRQPTSRNAKPPTLKAVNTPNAYRKPLKNSQFRKLLRARLSVGGIMRPPTLKEIQPRYRCRAPLKHRRFRRLFLARLMRRSNNPPT